MVPVVEALETHAGIATRMWGAALHRPTGYPKDLPFLADRNVTLLAVGDSHTLEWEPVGDSTAQAMARELMLDGWVETTLPESSMPGMRIRIFHRDGRQRVMIRNAELLTLLDTRAE